MVCRANVQLNVSVLLRLLVPFLGGTAESAPQIPQEGKVNWITDSKTKSLTFHSIMQIYWKWNLVHLQQQPEKQTNAPKPKNYQYGRHGHTEEDKIKTIRSRATSIFHSQISSLLLFFCVRTWFKWSVRRCVWRLWSPEGTPCCTTAVLVALLHGAVAAAFWFLWRGGRTVEHGVGTVVLSGMNSLQYVPALAETCVGADVLKCPSVNDEQEGQNAIRWILKTLNPVLRLKVRFGDPDKDTQKRLLAFLKTQCSVLPCVYVE